MKAVVMAGGNGSRLRPMLANSINKHLCPVGGKPLIHWPLKTLACMGITDVFMLGNGPRFLPVMEEVGLGTQFGLRVCYVYEPATAGQSVATHLLDIEPYVDNKPFMLMLGDSVYLQTPPIPKSVTFQTWAMPVEETWDNLDKYATVPGCTDLMQTGAWILPPEVFDAIRKLLEKTDEVRIRSVINHMYEAGYDLQVCVIKQESFMDCGTPEAVSKINSLLTNTKRPL